MAIDITNNKYIVDILKSAIYSIEKDKNVIDASVNISGTKTGTAIISISVSYIGRVMYLNPGDITNED